MPPKSRAARARFSLPSSNPDSKIRGDIQKTRRSRPLKQWRTSGIVDKQSTLTQIDFVRPASCYHEEELNLDYEDEEDTIRLADAPQEPRPKRRKIETANTNDRRKDTPASTTFAISNDKENEPLWAVPDGQTPVKSVFLTPRKPRNREVFSSQSPVTPLSTRGTRRHLVRKDDSPLKDLPINIPRQPRLYVEDSYKTIDTESTVSRTPEALLNTRSPGSMSKSTYDEDDGASHGKAELICKLEILDSDEELSDTERTKSSQIEELPLNLEGSTLLRSNSMLNTGTISEHTGSEAEIYKPPISDDSRDGKQDSTSGEEVPNTEQANQEPDTLDDILLLRSGRTYSGSRRRSIKLEVLSSSTLEELPRVDSLSQSSPNVPNQTTEVPSSPPTVLADKQSQPRSHQESEASIGQDHVSEAPQSDSQQVTVQLQQESYRLPRVIIPSSQASTASIPSSPVMEEAKARQSCPSRRGWFFNPLSDSQLLPDSIMNFELPRFPRMLGLRRAGSREKGGEEE